jgi:hypothetical protein
MCIRDRSDNIYTIAEALIKYDRSYKDAQEIFDAVCKEASINKGDQCLIKKAISQKVGQLKEAKQLPDDYDFNVELVDNNAVSEFSLGKFSLLKTAKESKSNAHIQPIVTDNGQVIKSVETLVNMAKNIESQKSKVSDLKSKKEKIGVK